MNYNIPYKASKMTREYFLGGQTKFNLNRQDNPKSTVLVFLRHYHLPAFVNEGINGKRTAIMIQQENWLHNESLHDF